MPRLKKIKSFEEARQRVDALNQMPARFLPIEVRKIVGSVTTTKVAMLTHNFLPREGGANTPRYRSVYEAMRNGVPLPPIEVYALKGQYYVVDGHNRVAAARALDYLYLDALVHEFLLPDTSERNRAYNERLRFEQVTGLSDVVLTEPGQYRKLLSQVREHRFFLGQAGQSVSLKAAAIDWREYVYVPITERLAASGVTEHFPDRTVADVYVYLCDYKWVRSQNKGMDIGFPKAMSDFERLYPPLSPTAAGLTTVRQVLRTLAAPVRRGGHEYAGAQDHEYASAQDDGAEENLKADLLPAAGDPVSP